jgi:ABC-type glycerol-3-phosphate transport system substrate-binding protein
MKLARKMIFLVLISLIAAGTLVAGGGSQSSSGGSAAPAASSGPFPGKIAVVTNTVDQNEEEFRSAEQLVRKYGASKVVHVTWPVNFMAEQEQMVTTVARLAADKDIKALIINQAVPGTNAAVDKLLETRKDIFIVYSQPQENPPDVARRANIVFNFNELDQGTVMIQQAKKEGAKVFVHYSFPRHMSVVMLAARRDLMRDE